MSQPDSGLQAAERLSFLHFLYGDVPTDSMLCAATRSPPPHGVGKGTWQQVSLSTVEEASEALGRHAETREPYVRLAAYVPGERVTRQHAMAQCAVFADVDAKAMPGRSEADRMNAAFRLAQTVPEPRWVLCTGYGYHVVVPLPEDRRLQAHDDHSDGVRSVEIAGRALRLYLEVGALGVLGEHVQLDRTHAVGHSVRVPHSYNMKTVEGSKQTSADRESWRRVTSCSQPSGSVGGRGLIPDLAFLLPYFSAAEDEQESSACATSSSREQSAQSQGFSFRVDELPLELRSRWPNVAPNAPSQSEHDFELACIGFNLGLSDGKIQEAIRCRRADLPKLADRRKGERRDYVEQTVRNARQRGKGQGRLHYRVPLKGQRDLMGREPDYRLMHYLIQRGVQADAGGARGCITVTYAELEDGCTYCSGQGAKVYRPGRKAVRNALTRLRDEGLIELPDGAERSRMGREGGRGRRGFSITILDWSLYFGRMQGT